MNLLLTGLLMSPVALIVILIVALLVFGKRLPEVARSLGKGITEFKKGVKGIEDDVDRPLPPPGTNSGYPQGQYPPQQYNQPYNPNQYPGAPQGSPGYSPPPGQSPEQAQYGQYGQYGQPGAPAQQPPPPPPPPDEGRKPPAD